MKWCIIYYAVKQNRIWGYSSVGRALRSQCRSQGFESPYLHHKKHHPQGVFFCGGALDEGTRRAEEKRQQCCLFPPRVLRHRPPHAARSASKAMPMRKTSPPCCKNHRTTMTPQGGVFCGGALDEGTRSRVPEGQNRCSASILAAGFSDPGVTCAAWNASTACRWPKMSPRCCKNHRTTMTPQSGVFCGGALDEGTRRAEEKRQQCCLFPPRVLRHRPPHAARSASKAVPMRKTITPAGVFRSAPAACGSPGAEMSPLL